VEYLLSFAMAMAVSVNWILDLDCIRSGWNLLRAHHFLWRGTADVVGDDVDDDVGYAWKLYREHVKASDLFRLLQSEHVAAGRKWREERSVLKSEIASH